MLQFFDLIPFSPLHLGFPGLQGAPFPRETGEQYRDFFGALQTRSVRGAVLQKQARMAVQHYLKEKSEHEAGADSAPESLDAQTPSERFALFTPGCQAEATLALAESLEMSHCMDLKHLFDGHARSCPKAGVQHSMGL